MSLRPIKRIQSARIAAGAATCQTCTWKHLGKEAKQGLKQRLHRYPGHRASIARTRIETYTGVTA